MTEHTNITINEIKAIMVKLDPTKEYALVVPKKEMKELQALHREELGALKWIIFTDEGRIMDRSEVLKLLDEELGHN